MSKILVAIKALTMCIGNEGIEEPDMMRILAAIKILITCIGNEAVEERCTSAILTAIMTYLYCVKCKRWSMHVYGMWVCNYIL